MATNPKPNETATLRGVAEGLKADLAMLRDQLAGVRPVLQEAAALIAEVRELAATLKTGAKE